MGDINTETLEQPEQQSMAIQMLGSDPDTMVEKATIVARALSKIIDSKKLYTMIQGKKFVNVEGWTTLGMMLGVFPFVEWSKKLDREDEITYEARVLLKTVKGEVIGAAEAMASSTEKGVRGSKWIDEYAVRSMAETRATSKAFRLSASWIISLAGYEATPAEEITAEMVATKSPTTPINPDDYTNDGNLVYNKPQTTREAFGTFVPATPSQKNFIVTLLARNNITKEQFIEESGIKLDGLSVELAKIVIQKLLKGDWKK
jgi:hypothetical protein